jgi:hypothetical protein
MNKLKITVLLYLLFVVYSNVFSSNSEEIPGKSEIQQSQQEL